MSPVKGLAQERWLPRLGWIAKGAGLGDKSRELILPERLAQKMGTARVTELRVRLPYDLIGLPGEVVWPYTQPHVCPTFYRLQVPRQDRAGGAHRPVVCMSDGDHVYFREPGIVKEPGFDVRVRRGDPPTTACRRAEDGHPEPCPFSVAKKKAAYPPCTLVCQLHLLVLFPLVDGSGYGVEAGVYGLEAPPSKTSDVLAQLTLLRTLAGGHLTGCTFLLRWEETTTKYANPATGKTTTARFFAPRFEMVEDIPATGVAADEAIGVVEEKGADLGETTASGDTGAALQTLREGLQGLQDQYPGPDSAPGSIKHGQQQTLRGTLAAHTVNVERLVQALWQVDLSNLSAAQAAALIRWGQHLSEREAAELRRHLAATSIS